MARHPVSLSSTLSLALLGWQLAGADPAGPLPPPEDEDPAAIEAIALYPEEVRDAILEAAAHPELIVRLSRLQAGSQAAFERLLRDYPRHTREAVWDLARFPELVPRLAQDRPLTAPQLEEVAGQYPPEIRRAIVEYGGRQHELLVQVHDLRRQADADGARLLEGYPRPVQDGVRRLLLNPEILAILGEDLSSTILLGEAYRQNPRQVRDRAARLNLELARQHARSLAPTRSEAGPAPVAPAASAPAAPAPAYSGPYGEVARVYADQYAYDDRGLAGPAAPAVDERVTVTYYTYPYPYWFGYPTWYAGPVWGAGFGWYLTPRLRASVYLGPAFYYRLAAPRYHAAVWARRHRAPPPLPPRAHPRADRPRRP